MTLRPDEMRLHTRISLVLTALAAALVLALGSLWLKQTRDGIREEVEAATRVAEQWLTVSARELHAGQDGWNSERLLAHLRDVGRIRANALEVVDAAGTRRYLSPGPTYKAGRAAPGWFAAVVEPGFAARRVDAGELTVILHPDASRATLDAWDDLCTMAGWAGVLLAVLFFTVRHALDRALRPLGQVMAALDRTGRGCFDTRLPVFPEPELGRLAKAFNGMADRLVEAVNDNVRLGSESELNERLQARIEDDRRSIARELHDELAQGITAVRALAGAIMQRTVDQPALHAPAQSILTVAGQMQDGVRTILQRLRHQQGSLGASADDTLGRYLQAWQQQYPDIRLGMQLAGGNAPISDGIIQALVRITQEGLTNVVRHAAATRVEITLRRLEASDGVWLELVLADNGRGFAAPTSSPGCGLGLAGMRERAAALAGELRFDTVADGGTRLCVRLPLTKCHPLEETK
ncbi:MAG TPA: ATP-binding protein [Noviherbaspirillum sp.]|uniref:ATP-binding protein n=1 Tax=Noviherbaspirillum sp. TaxID=1926288 RepID=UPI002B47FB47|nr:ATP-binding protein [Noviherbaspirillum sp.]HJV84196.1 ATP-binding protein [Noviherbaspirillum sp.]